MLSNFFESDTFYTGPTVQDGDLEAAETSLGFRLPRSYKTLIRIRNGGVPKMRCFRTDFPSSWADDHVAIRAILGIGGLRGLDSAGPLGSARMIKEWGYPEIGIVICDMPSGGDDAVMLDYSGVRACDEPTISYIDEDRIPRRIAENFETFISGLYSCGGE